MKDSNDHNKQDENSLPPTPEISTSSFEQASSGEYDPEISNSSFDSRDIADPLSSHRYNVFAVQENEQEAQLAKAQEELEAAKNELASLEAEERRKRENEELGGVSSTSVAGIDVNKYRNIEFSEEKHQYIQEILKQTQPSLTKLNKGKFTDHMENGEIAVKETKGAQGISFEILSKNQDRVITIPLIDENGKKSTTHFEILKFDADGYLTEFSSTKLLMDENGQVREDTSPAVQNLKSQLDKDWLQKQVTKMQEIAQAQEAAPAVNDDLLVEATKQKFPSSIDELDSAIEAAGDMFKKAELEAQAADAINKQAAGDKGWSKEESHRREFTKAKQALPSSPGLTPTELEDSNLKPTDPLAVKGGDDLLSEASEKKVGDSLTPEAQPANDEPKVKSPSTPTPPDQDPNLDKFKASNDTAITEEASVKPMNPLATAGMKIDRQDVDLDTEPEAAKAVTEH